MKKLSTADIGIDYVAPSDLIFEDFVYFHKNKATLDKVPNGSDKKYSKELKNLSFISVEIKIYHVLIHK